MIVNPEVETIPTRPPGTCFGCGATQLSPGRDWFLDTDVDYFDTPTYRIQICNICMDLLANTCGYIKIGEEVDQYKRAIARLEDEIRGLDRYRRLVSILGLNDDRLSYLLTLDESDYGAESPDASESRTKIRVGENSDSGSVGSGEARLFEPADDKRMAELRPTKRNPSINI